VESEQHASGFSLAHDLDNLAMQPYQFNCLASGRECNSQKRIIPAIPLPEMLDEPTALPLQVESGEPSTRRASQSRCVLGDE
jgi:hypothetical protein